MALKPRLIRFQTIEVVFCPICGSDDLDLIESGAEVRPESLIRCNRCALGFDDKTLADFFDSPNINRETKEQRKLLEQKENPRGS